VDDEAVLRARQPLAAGRPGATGSRRRVAWPRGDRPVRLLCVVPSWNRKGALLACLRRVVSQVAVPPAVERDVLVVDNASSDGSREAVRARFPTARVLDTGANLGGSGAFRRGLQHALEHAYDLVWLLDSDAYPSRRTLARYLAALSAFGPDALVGGTMHVAEEPRRIHEAGGLFGLDERLAIHLPLYGRRSTLRLRDPSRCAEVDYLAFANVLFPVDLVRRIGLPEDLFLHYDDVEFCLRARQAGYRAVNVADAVFWHESGQAKPATWIQYYDARNSLHTVARARPGELARQRRRLLYGAAKQALLGRPALARLMVQGIHDQVNGVTGRVEVSSRGCVVHDVRLHRPATLLEEYRCGHLVLDWDSFDDLLGGYRRAWCEFLARDADRVFFGLDAPDGTLLFDYAQSPCRRMAGARAGGPVAVERTSARRILADSLCVRSRERSGVRARLRCHAGVRLYLHGAHLIDYNRLDRRERIVLGWRWLRAWVALVGG